MFGELPKLFDRDFAIAYFLPSASFVAVTYLILNRFGLSPVVLTLTADSSLKYLVAFGLLSLLGGILLLISNRPVVRLLEGYWPFEIGYRLNWLELRRFRKLVKDSRESDEAKETHRKEKKEFPRILQNKRNKIKEQLADRFPEEERLILPTSFGNTYRAFERYPRVMYGINAIPAWYRLLAVVPKDYRALADSARARVDFWVNLCFLGVLVILEYYVVGLWANRIVGGQPDRASFPWIPIFALLFSRASYLFARNALSEWGNWVKASFDLYLPEMRTRLGLAASATREDERRTWVALNKAVLYRIAEEMPEAERPAQPAVERIEKDVD